jgi:hypothetical protein
MKPKVGNVYTSSLAKGPFLAFLRRFHQIYPVFTFLDFATVIFTGQDRQSSVQSPARGLRLCIYVLQGQGGTVLCVCVCIHVYVQGRFLVCGPGPRFSASWRPVRRLLQGAYEFYR